MVAQVANLEMDKNSDEEFFFDIADDNGDAIDLTGWTIKLQVRNNPGCNVLFEADNGGIGGITLQETVASSGVFDRINITIPRTTSINFDFCNAKYDLSAIDTSDDLVYFVKGNFTVNSTITR